MSTAYFPGSPYWGTYYVKGTAYNGYVTNKANLWAIGTRVRARIKVDYTISGTSANMTVYLQLARENGDYGTYGTTTPYIDGNLTAWTGTISANCARRNDSECTLIPDSYFTTIGSKSFTGLTVDSSGNFSKSITVGASSSNSNMALSNRAVTVSFGGGWSNCTSGSISSVVDNGNNTVTVSGYIGLSGANNPVTSSTLFYIFSTQSTNQSIALGSTSGGSFSKTIAIPADAYAFACYIHTYSDKNNAYSQSRNYSVKYYDNPGNPGKPTLSYQRKGPTLKEALSFNWEAASPGTNTPIVGYRLRLYKNGSLITGVNPNDASAYYYDTNSTSTTYSFDASALGFKVGDTIKLGIYSYGKNAAGDLLFNGGGTGEAQVESDAYTFINAGIIRIKKDGIWKEGQVYIKVNGIWKEADSVYIKKDGLWKESI